MHTNTYTLIPSTHSRTLSLTHTHTHTCHLYTLIFTHTGTHTYVDSYTHAHTLLPNQVATVTAEDFNVTPSLADRQWDFFPYVSNSPSACMEVYECPEFSLGIFLIKPNKAMPLHDHPGMHGIM